MDMQSIQSTLRKMASSQSITEKNNALLQEIKRHPKLIAFLQEHPSVTDEQLLKGLPKAYEYVEASHACEACQGLALCKNLLKGHHPELFMDRGALAITYKPCRMFEEDKQKRRQASLLKGLYVPKDVLKVTFKTLDTKEEGRHDALEAAGRFVERYSRSPKEVKGLYFHGKFGVGKTYIMGAIMNALAEQKGVESLMVYTPDFFRELRGAIQENTLNEKIDYIQKVPVLILDDVGAENMSPWVRDEVLGSILQHRMMESLPTLYTSNYDYDELEEHLSYSSKSGVEEFKAKRLMERIRYYSSSVAVTGENRRAL